LKVRPERRSFLGLEGAARAEKFSLAALKYEAALAIKLDYHEALNNWGTALSAEAEGLDGKARAEKFSLSGLKYEAALAIKPDSHEALNNWGAALSVEARLLSGDARRQKLLDAEEKSRKAREILGKSNYNFACTLAMQGQISSALDELEACHKDGTLETRPHLENDPDLDVLRENPRFLALLEKVLP